MVPLLCGPVSAAFQQARGGGDDLVPPPSPPEPPSALPVGEEQRASQPRGLGSRSQVRAEV